jgi:hypothetical protein
MRQISEVFNTHIVNRVFRHELGHYIANEINYNNGKATASKAIIFFPCVEGTEDLCGNLVVEQNLQLNPKNEIVRKDRLPEFIAKVIMGCVFQCYFDGLDINTCFDRQGKGDCSAILKAKNKNGLNYDKKIALSKIEDGILQTLKNYRSLEFINELDANEFIVTTETENMWQMDMVAIRAIFNHPDYNAFEKQYNRFVYELRSVIEELITE